MSLPKLLIPAALLLALAAAGLTSAVAFCASRPPGGAEDEDKTPIKPLVMGPGFPEWVPAGEGMIDYRTHFRALEGYAGPVSLEPHMGEIGRCYEALKSIIGPQMDTDKTNDSYLCASVSIRGQ